MTLQEAIEEVRREADEYEYDADEIKDGGFGSNLANAIATILNAVVKGELK